MARPAFGTFALVREPNVPPDLSVVRGRYLEDILDQPRALQRTLEGLTETAALVKLRAQIRRKKFQRVVLTGMGSSFHALHPATLQLIDYGFTAFMLETSELLHYQARLLDSNTLLVMVSQSGRSAEVVRLLKQNDERATVVGITNTADSPLAKSADAVVLTAAGQEFSVSCKTYVTALMALQWLADFLTGRELRRKRRGLQSGVDAARVYLSRWESHVAQLAYCLENVSRLFLMGRGPSLAAVGTGALIIKESTQVHAEGMSSAAFRHGPLEMLNPQTFSLIFPGAPRTRKLNWKLLRNVQGQGAPAEIVGEDATRGALRLPKADSSVHPLLEILPVQMVTLALAALAGREPGRFRIVSKITSTE